MRDIKFRAWDKYWNEMRGAWTIESISDPMWDEVTEPIWMQYTGLKDKNGKEIYEGDIIRYIYGAVERIDDVTWGGVEGFSPWDEDESMYYRKDETIEVIGNIYENKDLL